VASRGGDRHDPGVRRGGGLGVREGEADLAILLGHDEEAGLNRMRLCEEAGMVALSAEHALAVGRWCSDPTVSRRPSSL
jgi:DNA-binding transcriptional LysR family regulator